MKSVESTVDLQSLSWLENNPTVKETLQVIGIALAVIATLAVVHAILHATVDSYAKLVNQHLFQHHALIFGLSGGAVVIGTAGYLLYRHASLRNSASFIEAEGDIDVPRKRYGTAPPEFFFPVQDL